MLTQDHRRDGREWTALNDQVQELAERLVQQLHTEEWLRTQTDRDFLQHILRKVRHPSVSDLKLTIDILRVFQNNAEQSVTFSEMYNHVLSLKREGLDVVAVLTPETYRALISLVSMTGKNEAYEQWLNIIRKRPADAARIMEIVRERDLHPDNAIALLDEMDKHHPALGNGVL